MQVLRSAISLTLMLAFGSASAQTIFYPFARIMATADVKEIIDPAVKLYFGTQGTPPLAEKSRPDSHTRSGISISPFGRDPDVLCREGFTQNLEGMIRKAKEMGFDTIFNIRGKAGNGTFNDAGFDCSGGRRTSEVGLVVQFGLTQEGAKRAEQPAPPAKPRKAPSNNALFLPLEEVLNSPEARAVLGQIKAYPGSAPTPAFAERYGPFEYDGEGDVKALGREGACRKAVAEALAAILDDVSDQGYNAIIRIRSYLGRQAAPNDKEIECEAGSKWASVTVQATLATVQ